MAAIPRFDLVPSGYGLSGWGRDTKTGLIVDGVLTALAASRVSERLSQNRYVQAFSRAVQSLPLAGYVVAGIVQGAAEHSEYLQNWLLVDKQKLGCISVFDPGYRRFLTWTSRIGNVGGAAFFALPVVLAAARHWAQSKDFEKLDFCLATVDKIISVATKTINFVGFTLLTLLACQSGVSLITTAFYFSLLTVQVVCLGKAISDLVPSLFSNIALRSPVVWK